MFFYIYQASEHCAILLASALCCSSEPGGRGVGSGQGVAAASSRTSGGGVGVEGSVVLSEGSVEWKRNQIVKQLRGAPCGMDASLGNAIVAGVAFHHAGLTLEERMIVEGALNTLKPTYIPLKLTYMPLKPTSCP